MKKITLESIKTSKFKALANEKMIQIKGGRDTPGGSVIEFQQVNNVPTSVDYNGKVVTEYIPTLQNYVRFWTSDSIGDGGESCYWGVGHSWVTA